MSSLRELLEQRAAENQSTAERRESLLTDWCRAVGDLVGRLESWLRDVDPKNVLRIERTSHRIRERQIGEYEVPGLRIVLGAQEIRVEPVARFSIGSMAGDALGTSIRAGRVDLTNVERRFMLYRRSAPGAPDDWVLVDDRTYQAQPLTREAFEDAVTSMLQ